MENIMIDKERAKLNPEDVFRSPAEVVTTDELTTPEKIDILKRWAYDLVQMEVAEEENMPGAHPESATNELDEVLEAIHQLGYEGPSESTDTKHG